LIGGRFGGYYRAALVAQSWPATHNEVSPDGERGKYLNSLDVQGEAPLLFFWRPASAERQEFQDLQGLRKKKTPGLQA
jgi:hypothetical protein